MMRIARWVIGGVAILVLLLVIAVAAWFFLSSQPDPVGQHVPAEGLSVAKLNARAGLYETATGERVLLMPSGHGGFALYQGEGYAYRRSSIIAMQVSLNGDDWAWSGHDGTRRPFRFIRNDAGEITGFERETVDGGWVAARKLAQPPYRVEAVAFSSDVALSGTLFLPVSREPVPGAVLIHGSGTSLRDGLWYVSVARILADAGIAVLLPDKRGSGRSAGEWRTAGFHDFAADALAAFEVLRRREGVATDAVGMVGMSQGGRIAPMAAELEPDVAFAVNLVSAMIPPVEQVRHEIRQQLRAAGVPDWLAPMMMPITTRMPARRRPKWWSKNGDIDPLPFWRRISQPSLVIYGSEDEADNVPVSKSVARLRGIARDNLDVSVIDGVGHSLVDPSSNEFHPEFLGLLPRWIHDHAHAGKPMNSNK